MELKQYLETLYDYNYWANKRYLTVAETLTEEQLFRKQATVGTVSRQCWFTC
jgi:uncharacterized damage-inducible protein DinB